MQGVGAHRAPASSFVRRCRQHPARQLGTSVRYSALTACGAHAFPASEWIEIDFLKLLSKHVVSCVSALFAYGLIGSVAYLVLALARRMGWLAGADEMVEALVTYCEVFVPGGIFVFSTA